MNIYRRGSAILMVTLGISITLFFSSVWMQNLRQSQAKRQIARLNANEAFYQGEISAWHGFLRKNLQLSPKGEKDSKDRIGLQFENDLETGLPILPTEGYPDPTQGKPFSLGVTKSIATVHTLIRRYSSTNATYRSAVDHSHCGVSMFPGTKFDLKTCLVATEDVVDDDTPDPTNCADWKLMTREAAPIPRLAHTAIWTGDTGDPATKHRMIVWGGNSGMIVRNDLQLITISCGLPAHPIPWAYKDADGSWVYFYNQYNDGGLYDPLANKWEPLGADCPLAGRHYHSMVWTGNTGNALTTNRVIIWGGIGNVGAEHVYNDGAIYNPKDKTWKKMSTLGAPTPRGMHAAAWTGDKMVVWGGGYGSFNSNEWPPGATCYLPKDYGDGGIYDPATDTWTPIPVAAANKSPSARVNPLALWTGSQVFIWGGQFQGTCFNDGRLFDPGSGTWQFVRNYGAPPGKCVPQGIWTGNKVIIFSSGNNPNEKATVDTNAIYDPVDHEWSPMTKVGAPNPSSGELCGPPMYGKSGHSILWTGKELIAWGGIITGTGQVHDWGASYYPGLKQQGLFDADPDKWTPMCLVKTNDYMHPYHVGHTTVWTGATGNPKTENRMIVWGGHLSYGVEKCKNPPPPDFDMSQVEFTSPTTRGLIYSVGSVAPTVGKSIAGIPTSLGPKALPDTMTYKIENVSNCNGLSGMGIDITTQPFDPLTGQNDTPTWKGSDQKSCGTPIMPGGMPMMPGMPNDPVQESWNASFSPYAMFFNGGGTQGEDHFQPFICMPTASLTQNSPAGAPTTCASSVTVSTALAGQPGPCPDMHKLNTGQYNVTPSGMPCPCCPGVSSSGSIKTTIEW